MRMGDSVPTNVPKGSLPFFRWRIPFPLQREKVANPIDTWLIQFSMPIDRSDHMMDINKPTKRFHDVSRQQMQLYLWENTLLIRVRASPRLTPPHGGGAIDRETVSMEANFVGAWGVGCRLRERGRSLATKKNCV